MPPRAASSVKPKERKEYEEHLIEELQYLADKKIEDVSVDLKKITIARAITLTKEIVQNTKIGFKLDNGTTYFVNDKTINQLLKNKIEDEHLPDGNRKDNEYQNLVSFSAKTKSIHLFRIEAEKRRPAGGFFKFLNATHFDFDRYGVRKEVRRKNYEENCLY